MAGVGGRGRSDLRVDVLGPLRLAVDGSSVDVRGPRRRALLAMLALAEGRTVTVDHLLDALWPAEGPESGRSALHAQVSRLRSQLGPAAGRLTTLQDGYRLQLGVDDLDLSRARALLRAARHEIDDDPAGACTRLREAHGLWRGAVLADLTDVVAIATAVRECERLRDEVTRLLVSAAVAAGQADAVLGLAAEVVAAAPLDEPAVLLLVRALAAAGRAPEALRVAREYRRTLADETGLDPSPALDGLERDVAGGLAGPAPPRREASVRATTPLFGRDADVARLRGMLAPGRLVTIVGPGGVGKTRVALEVAGRAEPAAVLMLAPVTEQAALAHVLAAALDLRVTRGDVLAACVALLGDRAGVLVIDNCEHLLDAARDTVAVLLARCPRLSVLATSREPLGLAEEHVLRLAPLRLPAAGEQRADVASVALFLDRAARVRPGRRFPPDDLGTVADIVCRLDGMPLAIELAAGRLSAFSLAELRDRLHRALDLLAGGRTSGDARHRTLRATVEWSYRLLAAGEQRLFRHLAVFVDGVDLDTAEAVATELGASAEPGTVLARLVDASMVDAAVDGGSGGTRYRMLETLRAFGLDRLVDAGEEGAAQERLVRWAVEQTGRIGTWVTTEREPQADALLRRELPNLRAAWRTARQRGSVDGAAAIVSALFEAAAWRDLVEIRGWAAELADDPELAGHPRATAVLGTAAYAAYLAGDYPRADRLARAGLAHAPDGADVWYCWHALSVAALARGDFALAAEHAHAAAATAPGPRGHRELAALATLYRGDVEEARALNVPGAVDLGAPTWLAFRAYVDGEIASYTRDLAAAEAHYLRAIDLAKAAGTTFYVGVATVGLLAVRAAAGRVDEALDGYRHVIDYFARNGNWTHLWATLRNLADLLRRLGDPEPAAVIDAAADRAPDAPAIDRPPAPAVPVPGRAAVLALARAAIERHLSR